MEIKGEWTEPCPECDAMGSCCAAAKERFEAARSLSRLVDRQSSIITELEQELRQLRGAEAHA